MAASGELALAFAGGGARGAYQVGFVQALSERYPDLVPPILTGVSVGAINASYLANHGGRFAEKAGALAALWSKVEVDDVFRVDSRSLGSHLLRGIAQLTFTGGREYFSELRGLVDTSPLHELLRRALGSSDGSLPGIALNVERGVVRALAVTTTNYATGKTVTWCQGREVQTWDRPQRRAVQAELRVEHIMASAALPLFFPAVKIGSHWYGDGGIRLHAPLAPATHLGAERILALSTRRSGEPDEVALAHSGAYPPPAQVAGVLYNAVFLDMLDQDAAQLERVNQLLARCPGGTAIGLRPVRLLVIRPSQDLGRLAAEYEPRLPRLFRFLTRRLGTRQVRSSDLLSMVMFQGDYLARLIELGRADAAARADEVAAFIEG